MDNSEFTNDQKESTKSQSQADRIVALIDRLEAELFHDQYEEPYARYKIKDHYEIHKIRGKQFLRWMTNEFWKAEKKFLATMQ